MKTLLLGIATATLLAACQNETIVGGGNEPVADTANVVLPPSISASKTYRCKDNSLVHIDWLSDSQSANFRADKSGTPVHLTASAAGEAMVAQGFSLTGDSEATSISIARPGKPSQSCHS